MGQTDSKLVVRQQISRLCSEHVSPDHRAFWSSFWKVPATADDVSNLVASTDLIRTLISNQRSNFETLFLKCSLRLLAILDSAIGGGVPVQTNEIIQVLNCARILTRLVPFLFEEADGELERKLLLAPPPPTPVASSDHASSATSAGNIGPAHVPLGHLLVKAAIDLCSLPGLVGEAPDHDSPAKRQVWRAGIGRSEEAATSATWEANRIEAVRFLFAMTSRRLYDTPEQVAIAPDWYLLPFLCRPPASDVLVHIEKQELLVLLCSLLNTFLSYSSSSWLPYGYLISSEPIPEELAGLCARWLVCMCFEARLGLDADGAKTTTQNAVRFYLSKLHRPSDLSFLASNLSRLLTDFAKSDSWVAASSKPSHFGEETVSILWIMVSCNAHFVDHVLDSEFLAPIFHGLLCVVLKDIGSKVVSQAGVGRIATNVLHLLSSNNHFCERISYLSGAPPVLPIKGLGSSVPTYGDALVVAVAHVVLHHPRGIAVDGMVEQLVLVVFNLSPFIRTISVATAQKLNKMLVRVSEPAFLLGAPYNWRLLAWSLDITDSMLRYNFPGNVRAAYSLVVEKRAIDHIQTMTFAETARAAELALKGHAGGDDGADSNQPDPDANGSPKGSAVELTPIKGKEKAAEFDVDVEFWTRRSAGFVPTPQWWESWFPFLPIASLLEMTGILTPVVAEACEGPEPVTDGALIDRMINSEAIKLLYEPKSHTVRPYVASAAADQWLQQWAWAVSYAKAGGGSIAVNSPKAAVPTLRVWVGTRIRLFPVVGGQ